MARLLLFLSQSHSFDKPQTAAYTPDLLTKCCLTDGVNVTCRGRIH